MAVPLLGYIDLSQQMVHTDVSNKCIEACLTQSWEGPMEGMKEEIDLFLLYKLCPIKQEMAND